MWVLPILQVLSALFLKKKQISGLLLNGGNENVSKELGKGNFQMRNDLKHHIA